MTTRTQRFASIACALALLLSASPKARAQVSIQNGACSVSIDPASLEVTLRSGDKPAVLLSAAQTNLGAVANLEKSATRAKWSLPERKVSVTLELTGSGLSAHVLADEPGEFTFPVIPETPSAKGWILPFFEGVYAPCGDAKWQKFLTNCGEMNTTADLTMPFIGLDYGGFTVTYILTNAFNNQLVFRPLPQQRTQARLTHQFTRNHPVKEYGLLILLGTNSLIEPARAYREWLIQRGEFVSLKEKIHQTPEAAKLLGAAHVYLWGTELLNRADVTNWKQFARELKAAADAPAPSPAKRIWSLLLPPTRELVTGLAKAEWPDRYTTSQIAEDLNRLLLQRDFYDAAAWNGVALDAEVSGLLKTNRGSLSQADLCRLNSLLLAAAFPKLVAAPETWGNGTSPKMIQQLAAAGFDRLWLGSDGWEGFINRPDTVAAAKKAGFLIGPYDSFNGIQLRMSRIRGPRRNSVRPSTRPAPSSRRTAPSGADSRRRDSRSVPPPPARMWRSASQV